MVRALAERGADDVLVFAGGIIPEGDVPGLSEAGIDAVFPPGTPTGEIVEYLKEKLAPHVASSAR